MSQAGELDSGLRTQLIATVSTTMQAAAGLLSLQPVVVEVNTDQSFVIPELGAGGYNPSTDRVQISIDLGRDDLETVIQEALPLILAHELHHAKRRATVGYGATLIQAVASEGLADHFALELLGGDPPPWAVALERDELEAWIAEALAYGSGPYDHAQWFLGADGTIPRWAGYSIGFSLVADFLADHPEALPSTLVDDPAWSIISG